MAHQYWLCAVALTAACATASLGVDDHAVPVSVDRVVWNDMGDGHHHGIVSLVEDSTFEPVWQLHLEVEDAAFAERRGLEVSRLPLGSRVYLVDPADEEFRGRFGPLTLSRRGGGALDAVFSRPGEPPTVALALHWTSWHVNDRRLLGAAAETPEDPSLTR